MVALTRFSKLILLRCFIAWKEVSHVLRGTYNLIPSAKYHQCQQLPNQSSVSPLSWLTPTVHPLLHKEVHTSYPASSYCPMFGFSALLTFVGLCDFCLGNSSKELWYCPGHGTDFICKDPVLSGLNFWWRLLGQLHCLWVRTWFCLRSGSWGWCTESQRGAGLAQPSVLIAGAEPHLKPYTKLSKCTGVEGHLCNPLLKEFEYE